MSQANGSPNKGKFHEKKIKNISKLDHHESPTEEPKDQENNPNLNAMPSLSAIEPVDQQQELEADETNPESPKKKRKMSKKGVKKDDGNSVEKRFLCSHCGFRTTTLTGLTNHSKSHTQPRRTTKKEVQQFLCPTCGFQTRWLRNVDRHLETHKENKRHKCNECRYQTSDPVTWARHLKSTVHKRNSLITNGQDSGASASRKFTNCPDCDLGFARMDQLDHHLEVDHGYKLESEQLSFTSMEQVKSWLQSLQAKNQKYCRARQNASILYCHRSGKFKASVSTRKRALKKQGSCKSGKTCPSRVKITPRDGIYNVTHYKTHVGHDLDPTLVPISFAFKEQIASDLVSGMSEAEVISKYRVQFETEGIRPLTVQDLRNIYVQFGLLEILKELQDAPNPDPNASPPPPPQETDVDDDNSLWDITAEEVHLVSEGELPHPDPRVVGPSPPDATSRLTSLQNQFNQLMQLVQSQKDAELVINLLSSPVRTAIAQLQSECQHGAGS